MATQEEHNFITKTRNEFVMSAENAIRGIQFKFADFHTQLDRGENILIEYVEEIRANILQKFDEITPKLKEIQQCRDSVISILTNNSNKQLLETQLHSFTTEIDGVIGQSGIDNLIRLKWRYCDLKADNICQISAVNSSKRRPTSDVIINNSHQVTDSPIQLTKKQVSQHVLLDIAKKRGIQCEYCMTQNPSTATVCIHCRSGFL